MVKRFTVTLEQDEYSALFQMAMDDLRNPSDELRHLLRLEIERRIRGNLAVDGESEAVLVDVSQTSK